MLRSLVGSEMCIRDRIKDRKKEIIYTSEILSPKECLVILGKGHEETQDENNKTIFFSDHEVINEIYK